MSVSFPSASGGASYDPTSYLTNPASAIADPVDTVDLTSIGKPPAVTAVSAAGSSSGAAPASSTAGTGNNASTSNYGTGNNSLGSLYGTGNSNAGTANSATSNLASLLDPANTSTSNSITSNLHGYLNPTANGNPSSPTAATTTPSTSSAAASASNASSWQQEYQNFLADNTTYLLDNTFGTSSALDQPSAAFGSTAALNAITNSTLGVLAQASALQNPQTLAFQEPSTGSSTGGTVDTTA